MQYNFNGKICLKDYYRIKNEGNYLRSKLKECLSLKQFNLFKLDQSLLNILTELIKNIMILKNNYSGCTDEMYNCIFVVSFKNVKFFY